MDFDASTNQSLDATFTFLGSYTRSVDAKGRFALPFRFRQGGSGPADETYMVSKGADGSLSLQPYTAWEAKINRMRQAPPSAELRADIRRMSLSAIEVKPDSQGRIGISPETLAGFGIGKKVTVVGMGSYMELWDPEALEKLEDGDVSEDFMNEFYR